MVSIKSIYIIFFYSILYFNIITLVNSNISKRTINIQYFLIRNRLSHLNYDINRTIKTTMEIEMKKNYINGYNDAIKNFNGNSTLAEFIRDVLNEELQFFTNILLFPFDMPSKKQPRVDHFKYKITPYIEKIHYLDLPPPYKTKLISYCDYSNIKMIRSVYKINKLIKVSTYDYQKVNIIKTFIKWKIRKMIL